MYWGLAGSVGTQGPGGSICGIRGHIGDPRGVGTITGCVWASEGIGVSGVYWEAGRDCR